MFADMRTLVIKRVAHGSCCVLQMKEVEHELSPHALDHARKVIWWWSGALCFILVIAWPALSLPAGVFSQARLSTPLTGH